MKHFNIRQTLIYIILFCIPVGTKIIYNADRSYIGGVFSYTQALFLYGTDILFAALFVSWFFFGGLKPISRVQTFSLFAFVLWAILSLFHVKQLDIGVFHAAKWLELGLFSFIVSQSISRETIPKALAAILASGLFQAGLGIWQFHVQHMVGLGWLGEYLAPIGTSGLATIDIGTDKLIRAYGTFPHPNIYGTLLILSLFASLYFVSRETGWKRWLVSCGTIILVVGIFVSFSRLAWAMAAMAIVAFCLYSLIARNYKNLLFYGVIGLVSCGTVMLLYGSYITERARELNSESKSVVLRESFNKMAISIWQTKPLTGIGVGQYIGEMQSKYDLEDWQYQPPHNVFLLIMVELGLGGLILFLWFILSALGSTWNTGRKSLEGFTLISALIVFLIISNFDHYFATIQQGQLMFFGLLGLMLAQAKSEPQNVPSD